MFLLKLLWQFVLNVNFIDKRLNFQLQMPQNVNQAVTNCLTIGCENPTFEVLLNGRKKTPQGAFWSCLRGKLLDASTPSGRWLAGERC
jgi:hypothetical protein